MLIWERTDEYGCGAFGAFEHVKSSEKAAAEQQENTMIDQTNSVHASMVESATACCGGKLFDDLG